MGWKSFSDKFGLKDKHICIDEKTGHLAIGSGCSSNLITINTKNGAVKFNEAFSRDTTTRIFQSIIDLTDEERLEIFNKPDHFDKPIPIYSPNRQGVPVKYTYEKGYSTTTTGEPIFTNTFFLKEADALAYGKEDIRLGIEDYNKRVKETKKQLEEYEQGLAELIKCEKHLSTIK